VRHGGIKPGQIGSGTIVGCNAIIYENVVIGKNCLIGDNAIIRENVIIGDNTVIGQFVCICHDVTVGNDTRIMEYSHIVGHSTVGNNVFIGPRLTTSNDNAMGRSIMPDLVGVTIHDRARLGISVFALPGITIGENALVAAGSGLTKDVPPNMIVMGIPARVIRPVEPEHDED
jgi:acetyltransferase-like isoleucine patch superfamily enzyme